MIHEERGQWFTLANITGSQAEVEQDIEKYFREFDPRGYDTEILVGPTSEQLGSYKARLRRFTSCD